MAIDRTKISFAEAEGRSKFPAILNWGQIDQRLRTALWTPIYVFFSANIKFDGPTANFFWGEPVSSILFREFLNRQHGFINDYTSHFFPRDFLLAKFQKMFASADYAELLDFVTFLVRDPACPAALINEIAGALNAPYSPYRLSRDAKTIFPAIEEHQGQALERDLATAFSSSFAGSKSHIQSALNALGEGDYRATVRESIHAVESAVRDFTSDPNAVLSKALKSLVSEQSVHKALADAFDKLYAYSSDENGIRHALVFGKNEKVGLDEAVFFLSACTAFVGFLTRKKLQSSSET
jgi:hypothetical protein